MRGEGATVGNVEKKGRKNCFEKSEESQDPSVNLTNRKEYSARI